MLPKPLLLKLMSDIIEVQKHVGEAIMEVFVASKRCCTAFRSVTATPLTRRSPSSSRAQRQSSATGAWFNGLYDLHSSLYFVREQINKYRIAADDAERNARLDEDEAAHRSDMAKRGAKRGASYEASSAADPDAERAAEQKDAEREADAAYLKDMWAGNDDNYPDGC